MIQNRIMLFENYSKDMNGTLKTNKTNGLSLSKGLVNKIKQKFEVPTTTSAEVSNSTKTQKPKYFFEIKRPPKKRNFNKTVSCPEKDNQKISIVDHRHSESFRQNQQGVNEGTEDEGVITRLVNEFGEKLKQNRKLRKSSSFNEVEKQINKELTEFICEEVEVTDKESNIHNSEIVQEIVKSEDNKINETLDIEYYRQEIDKSLTELKCEEVKVTDKESNINNSEIIQEIVKSEDNKINETLDIEYYRKEIDKSLAELKDFLDEDQPDATKRTPLHCHDTSNVDDDEFGLLSLDGNCDDNYIIEAYNDEGNELVITILDINRKSVKLDENAQVNYNKSMKELIKDSDIVFHRDDTNSSLEIIKNIDSSSVEQSCENFNISRTSTANTDDSGIEKDCRNTPNSLSYSTESLSNNGYTSCEEDLSACRRAYLLDSSFDNTKCHTVVDNDGNIRIKKVCSIKNDDEEIQQLVNETEHMLKSKLSYIIEELKATEELYINGLHKVVYDYKPYIEQNCPNHLIGKTPYLFGNIVQIYEGGKIFLDLLKKTDEDTSKIAKAFIDSVSTLKLYPKYSKNKPTSDCYLKEFEEVIKKRQAELGDRLDLASYLLTPIQRLGKYILMLDNIRKELKGKKLPTDDISQALEMIRTEMKMGNDSIAVDSIKNCKTDLLTQGSFIMREKFNLIKPKKLEVMLFLFDNIVVITHNNTKNLEEFNYFDSIEMTDLSIASFETEPLIFHLSDYPKCKRGQSDRYTFVLEAKSPKIKHLWTENIEKRLWEQLEKCRQKLKGDYDIQGKRFSTIELPKRKKKKNSLKRRSLTSHNSEFYDNIQ